MLKFQCGNACSNLIRKFVPYSFFTFLNFHGLFELALIYWQIY